MFILTNIFLSRCSYKHIAMGIFSGDSESKTQSGSDSGSKTPPKTWTIPVLLRVAFRGPSCPGDQKQILSSVSLPNCSLGRHNIFADSAFAAMSQLEILGTSSLITGGRNTSLTTMYADVAIGHRPKLTYFYSSVSSATRQRQTRRRMIFSRSLPIRSQLGVVIPRQWVNITTD